MKMVKIYEVILRRDLLRRHYSSLTNVRIFSDRPISYISVSQQSWGQFVAGYITAKKYRNQGVGWALWNETIGKMEKENVGLTASKIETDKGV